MRGGIRVEVVAEKDRNFVNGVCDFCGDGFASRILILRPQKWIVEKYKKHEFKFCDECFEKFESIVNNGSLHEGTMETEGGGMAGRPHHFSKKHKQRKHKGGRQQ